MALALPKLPLPQIDLAEVFPSFFPSKELLGIDIGSYALKVVHLKKSADKWVVQSWIYELLSEENVAELSPEERKAVVVSKIKKIVSEQKIQIKKTVVSVCGSAVIVRYVKFPKLSPQELNKTISFEAEPYIPFAISDVNLGFHILRDIDEEGQKKMETILVAVKKEIIQNRLEIIREANLQPAIIDIDAFALENALETAHKLSPEDTVVVVNCGASLTNLAIIENGVSKVVRDIFIAGNSFTKSVQRNLGVDLAQAEEMKKQYGMLVTPEEKELAESRGEKEKVQVSTIITGVCRELVGEIQRSVDYYQTQAPDKTISKVYLTGGSSQLPNMVNYFEQELRLPIEIFDPTEGLTTIIPPLDMTKEKNPSFAIATGLAIRREGDSK